MVSKIAIVGQGVIGTSTALAILEKIQGVSITLFSDRSFEKTCSFGPAGLFRVDNLAYKKWAKSTFEWLAKIYRENSPDDTGVKLVSGHIQSESRENLETQEKCYADIVYNFCWLSDREIQTMFVEPSKYCIHYTAYASEGRKYVPWLQKACKNRGAIFITRKISSFSELANENFDVIINCAGLGAGKLAGDDDSVYPIRGVGIELDAPWHKHFNYRDFSTFTIPMNSSVLLGSVKQPNRFDLEITDEDRQDIWERYLKLQPTLKNSKVLAEWCGLRPARPSIRLERHILQTSTGQKFHVIHNYGHGGNGFTLGWGCAEEVADMVEEILKQLKSKI